MIVIIAVKLFTPEIWTFVFSYRCTVYVSARRKTYKSLAYANKEVTSFLFNILVRVFLNAGLIVNNDSNRASSSDVFSRFS